MTSGAPLVRAYVFTLDPSAGQEQALRSHCGAARFAYTHLLGVVRANLAQRDAERSYGIAGTDLTPALSWSAFSLRSEWNRRKHEVAPWWAQNSKEAYGNACADLADALRNWTRSRRGERAGRAVGFPRPRSRHRHMSCTFTTGTIRVEPTRHHVTLPRIGTVHSHESTRQLARLVEQGRARVTKATVSFRRGRWQVALLAHVQRAEPVHPRPGSVVGVDVGVKDLLVAATPDGRVMARAPMPAELRELQRRKAWLQRRHRNKTAPDKRTGQKGSTRWRRAQRRIQRVDHRVANLRDDLLHKATTDLADRFETVVVENLNVAGMRTRGGAHKRGLNRAITRAAISTTIRQLTYKTTWRGGTTVMVGRFYPSSKTCSGCGAVKTKLLLSQRTYTCTVCGESIDRDLNAAVNLARMGLAGSGPVTGLWSRAEVHPPSGVAAAGVEASTPRGTAPAQEGAARP